MFGKKNHTTDTVTPTSDGVSSDQGHALGTPLWNYLLFIYAVLSIVVIGAWIFNNGLQQHILSLRDAQQTQTVTQTVANRIAELAADRQAQLMRLGQDPALPDLFEQNNIAALDEYAQTVLQPQIADSIRIRLLPKEWNTPDPKANPPLSFASLDLLRQVEGSGKPTNLELHGPKTPNAHIALAAPIKRGDGELLGTLHASIRLDWLDRTLRTIPNGTALALTQQVASGKGIQVASNVPDYLETRITGSPIAVAGTIWSVGGYANHPSNSWPELGSWVLLLVSLATGFAAVGLIFRVLRRNIQQDQQDLFLISETLLSGKLPHLSQARVREFHQCSQLLLRAAKEQGVNNYSNNSKPKETEQKAETITEPVGVISSKPIEVQIKPQQPAPTIKKPTIAAEIFRAYDIRGIVGKSLTIDAMQQIGKAVGTLAQEQDQHTVIVGRDGRSSGSSLSEALIEGIMATGCDVVDLGQVPTPLLYFATHFLSSQSGVVITGSHNPPEYNGLKMVINGKGLYGDQINALHDRILQGDFLVGTGSRSSQSLTEDYIHRIVQDVTLSKPLKVVVDSGNGIAGAVAPPLLRALDCEVIELYSEVDGRFPNHHPDPSRPENLKELIKTVREQEADIGIAFDGDGDRLGVVDSSGKIIWPDRFFLLLAEDVLSRNPGADIIYDVKCSRHIAPRLLRLGGRPIMWKTGHSLIKAKMQETGALIGGEMSGHIFIRERWYGFDDALYTAARLLELLAFDNRSSKEIFAELPEEVSTPELHLPVPEGSQQQLMQKIIEAADFEDANLITIDGLRVEFSYGWGLVRASNTTPVLVFRFEAKTEDDLSRIQDQFWSLLKTVDPTLRAPF